MRLALLLLFVSTCHGQVVPYVEALVSKGRLADAESLTAQYRKAYGTTPEALAAMSWVARGELNNRQYDQAMKDADEVRQLVKTSLSIRHLANEPYLALALGATYEVDARALVALNRRSEALQLLQSAEKEWHDTAISSRLQKNVLLLTLVGRPMPEIQGAAKSWAGHPVLLFFWAHWCPDCKAMGPIIAKLAAEYEPKGLVVVAPTRLYGYTSERDNVSPVDEKRVLDQVFQRFYAAIPKVIVPINESNFDRYGASTTPTLVLADKRGIVQLYHPGALSERTLRDAIQENLQVQHR